MRRLSACDACSASVCHTPHLTLYNPLPQTTTLFLSPRAQWDNLFATLLAALDGGADAEAYAYSNLFQVMKSKTAAGFVPNYAAGGMRSQDRTEPPVGAKVTLEIFKKFNASWVVDVVWEFL